MKNLILVFLLTLGFSAKAQELFDTTTVVVSFGCNSAALSPAEEAKLDAISGVIISVQGFASIEGNSEKNMILSQDRSNAVSAIVDFSGTGNGGTEIFGGTRSKNRIVVVTYVTPRNTTSLFVLPVDETINTTGRTKNDIEGFTCVPASDILISLDTTVSILDTVVAKIKTPVVEFPVLHPVGADTIFLPTAQAVRFYMKKGMSRKEATAVVSGRKNLWKPIAKKSKKKRSKMRKTMGKNGGIMSRLFPFRGC